MNAPPFGLPDQLIGFGALSSPGSIRPLGPGGYSYGGLVNFLFDPIEVIDQFGHMAPLQFVNLNWNGQAWSGVFDLSQYYGGGWFPDYPGKSHFLIGYNFSFTGEFFALGVQVAEFESFAGGGGCLNSSGIVYPSLYNPPTVSTGYYWVYASGQPFIGSPPPRTPQQPIVPLLYVTLHDVPALDPWKLQETIAVWNGTSFSHYSVYAYGEGTNANAYPVLNLLNSTNFSINSRPYSPGWYYTLGWEFTFLYPDLALVPLDMQPEGYTLYLTSLLVSPPAGWVGP